MERTVSILNLPDLAAVEPFEIRNKVEEKHTRGGKVSHAISNHKSDALRNLSASSRAGVSPN